MKSNFRYRSESAALTIADGSKGLLVSKTFKILTTEHFFVFHLLQAMVMEAARFLMEKALQQLIHRNFRIETADLDFTRASQQLSEVIDQMGREKLRLFLSPMVGALWKTIHCNSIIKIF